MDRRANFRVRCKVFGVIITSCVCLLCCISFAAASRAAVSTTDCGCTAGATDGLDGERLEWHTNYAVAHAKAKRERRMLLLNFVPARDSLAQRQLEHLTQNDSTLRRELGSMVLVRLPSAYVSQADNYHGRLVEHPSFTHLIGGTGIAIIDLRHTGTPHYGRVVTALPFSSGKYYRWRPSHLAVALGLPPGTITQRTMIWAVRVHPESPGSTCGHCHRALTDAARKHSQHQAQSQVQGHQQWASRYHQVRLRAEANEAKEVVAESWPNQNLIDSCIDCVASWRHSPGHWRAVRGRHRLFGYDIRRGRNGVWYGTGIFAN